MPNIKAFIEKVEPPKWLLVILVICFVLRIPSFFEPYYYGDEMIYLTLGQGIKQGVPLYTGLHDNKPPLIYLVAAMAGNIFWFKVILAFWSLVTIVAFWYLVQKLSPKNTKVTNVSTIVFAIATTLPLIEGNIANAELFFIGTSLLALNLLFVKKVTTKRIFFAGFLFGISTLFKVPAFFDIFSIVFLWLFFAKFSKSGLFSLVKNLLVLFVGFVTPIATTLIWYGFMGGIKEYFTAAFLQNIGYLSSWNSQSATRTPFLVKNKGLVIRGVVTALITLFLFIKRNKLSKEFVFVCLWLVFSLFATTLSERPYPHYLLQSISPAAVLAGMLIAEHSILQVYSIVPLTFFFFVPFYFKFWTYPVFSYYQRFFNFTSGNTTKEQYFETFRGSINRNYEIAKMIKSMTNPNERVFVWGDDASIYALSKRVPPIKYIADYHIKDFSTRDGVIQKLSNSPPKIIVVLPEGGGFPELKPFLVKMYILLANIKGGEVYKLIDSGHPPIK